MRIAIGLVCVVLLGAALYQLSPLKTAAQDMQAQQPQRHPASHVIRITAKLSFDGVPVVIDDLIDCTMPPGVPEGASNIRFKMSRHSIPTEISGGGMIYFQASRKLCFAFGDVWGHSVAAVYTDPEYVFDVPNGWTPRLDWYNHRNPREATRGLIYVSETALWAENGRLRIIQPFKVEIPKHPSSPELIEEARKQISERALFPTDPSFKESLRFKHGKMPRMIRISEEEWRYPERRPGWESLVARNEHRVDHAGLVEFLDSHMDKTALVDLGFLSEVASDEINLAVNYILRGRRAGLESIGLLGIPQREEERFGLPLTKKGYERMKRSASNPKYMDEYISWYQDDGVVRADFDNPGLIHWHSQYWHKSEVFKGFDLFGRPFTFGEIIRVEDWPRTIFDPLNGDLWKPEMQQ
ncbi:MAG: hypothetical protein AAGA71_21860 [Pseudomonadota bacterium]